MTIKKEASGRRSIEVEFDVPGTPEEVWNAIATGPGISSWFVPAVIEEHDGKPVTMKLTFGPGMEPTATVTEWDPPRLFSSLNESWAGAPRLATEWNIEARAGGVCRIRIVQSMFASTDEWDDQLAEASSAFGGFFRTLQLYLTHFRGQRSAHIQCVVPVAGTEAEAWEKLTAALGVKSENVSRPWTAPADAPALSGVVEAFTKIPYDALLRLDKPGPGIVALGVYNFPGGDQTMVATGFYIYGDRADETIAQVAPAWEAWVQKRFPRGK